MKHEFAEMTWSEIRTAAEEGAVALLPTASIEQHGPHLPTKTDTFLVSSVVEGALERLSQESGAPRIVCAPTLWLGASDHHRRFFALSLSETTYVAALRDVCASIAEAGFGKLFIINGHGGNTSPLRVAISHLRKTAPELLIATADYWTLAAAEMRKIRVSGPGGAAHGGEIETSLMMHLAQSSVKADKIERSVTEMPEGFEIDLIDGGAASIYAAWETLSESGHLGDPTVSDPDRGQRFFEASVSALARTLRAFGEHRR